MAMAAELARESSGRTAGDLARAAEAVAPEAAVEDVIELMTSSRLQRLPIVSRERIVGVLDLSDLAPSHDVTEEQVDAVRRDVADHRAPRVCR